MYPSFHQNTSEIDAQSDTSKELGGKSGYSVSGSRLNVYLHMNGLLERIERWASCLQMSEDSGGTHTHYVVGR